MKMMKSLHRLARGCLHHCTWPSPGLVALTIALARVVPSQADDFLYRTNNGSVSVVGYQGTNWEVVVPSSFEGVPVTSVESLKVPKMVSCTFSEGIVSIGSSALNGCESLTNVTFPRSLTTIGSRAFGNCYQLSSVVIGSGVTNLGASAFEGSGLRSVSMPDGLVEIGSRCFASTGLTNIAIPKSVTNIGNLAFYTCSSLSAVDVAPDNPAYSSLDGVLYNKDQTRLILLPPVRTGTYQLPDSVEIIGDRSCWASGLTELVLPASVNEIESYAFESWSGGQALLALGDAPVLGSSALKDSYQLTVYRLAEASGWSATFGGHDVILWSQDFGYTIKNGSVVLMSYLGPQKEEINIPHTIDGMDVTELGTGLFAVQGWVEVYEPSLMDWLKRVTIPDTVTTIGSSAFANCVGLTEVRLPDTVRSLGASAYAGCIGLTNISLSAGLSSISAWAFFNCTNLTDVVIPDGVTNIAESAFSNCRSLSSLTLPDSLEYIGLSAFSECSKLTDVEWGNGPIRIENVAFQNCSALTELTLPDGLKEIGQHAFIGCSELRTVTLGANVTNIGIAPFIGCRSLESITVEEGNPAYSSADGVLLTKHRSRLLRCPPRQTGAYAISGDVKTIADSAFDGCKGLTAVTIPEGVTMIGASAFAGCTGLTSMVLPNSVTTLTNSSVFSGCENLVTIRLPEGLRAIGDYVFQGCRSLTTISIPDAVETIGSYAFAGCTALVHVRLHEKVSNILYYAFQGCTSLAHIDLPSSIRLLGGGAFSGCTALAEITIPNGVLELQGWVFTGCPRLSTVTIPASVRTLDPSFAAGSSLGSLVVDALNTSFSSFDGVVYNKSQSKLVFCPPGKLGTVFLPATVRSITNGFSGCLGVTGFSVDPVNTSFTSIDGVLFNKSVRTLLHYPPGKAGSYRIPDGVTSFTASAFENCPNLTALAIPASLRNMAYYQFNCPKLAALCFLGDPPVTGFYSSTWVTVYHVANARGWETGYYGYPSALWSPPFIYEVQTGEVRITGLIPEGAAVSVPSSIEGLPVTRIAARAFADTTTITNVSMPAGLTRIEPWAFQGCAALKTVAIPDTVTDIGEGAFARCPMLNGVRVPPGIKGIANWAFTECPSLTEVVIPESVKRIGVSAFDGCRALERVVGAQGLEQIDGYAFFDCAGLNEFTWPKSLQAVGPWAFAGCASLPELELPPAMITLGEAAFFGCSALQSVSIPARVQAIGEGAFAWCDALESISVDALNPDYSAGDGVLFSRDGTLLLQCPAGKAGSYQVPGTVVGIAGSAFAGCAKLTDLSLPHTVTTIGPHAFEYCRGLSRLTLPAALEEISESALEGCDGLSQVTVPATVKAIGSWACADCSNLRGVYFEGNCPDISESAFYNVDCTVHYLPGTMGWTTTCAGHQTGEWLPELMAIKPEVTGEPETFEVQIFWVQGKTLVLEASTDLANPTWTAVATVTVASDGSFWFRDPDYRTYPFRVYRCRTP
ncbi:MAG: leucine-rich repeat protein [Verrucomicrobiia bacterium]